MFSNQLDKARQPLASRRRGITLGSIMMIAVAAALVSARTVAFTFWITFVGFFIAALARGSIDLKWSRGPVALSLTVFLLYALLSAAWAAWPLVPLEKASVALCVALASLFLVEQIRTETVPNLMHMGEGVFFGLLVGGLYLVVELLSDQAIAISVYRWLGVRPQDLTREFFTWDGAYLVAISREHLNRNMTDAVLFLWPAVMAMQGVWQRRRRCIAVALLVSLVVVIVMWSDHASSQLALIAGFATFAIARLSPRWSARIVMLAWLTLCLAAVPLALVAYRLDLHHAPWLQGSARHRIIIWHFTAERTLQRPLFGVGANMTYVLGPQLEKDDPASSSAPGKRTLSIHSHSIYVQTWFELGLVGAVLLASVGQAILGAIRRLASPLQSYGLATFATAAAMAAVSYGMWQAWFVASFGLCAALFALGVQCLANPKGDGETCDQPRLVDVANQRSSRPPR